MNTRWLKGAKMESILFPTGKYRTRMYYSKFSFNFKSTQISDEIIFTLYLSNLRLCTTLHYSVAEMEMDCTEHWATNPQGEFKMRKAILQFYARNAEFSDNDQL